MKLLRRILRWPWFRVGDAELAEEIEAHRALVQADLETRGVPPGEARAESRRIMGNTTLAREQSRDVWVASWADRLWRNVKYGVRGLRREPTFGLTATLTLALGVATTTTVFSVVDAELWKPLPYINPAQLVVVYSRLPGAHSPTAGVSGADLLDWRDGVPGFTSLAAAMPQARRVLHLDHAESVTTMPVTANYFSTLGRGAIAGRVFGPDDARGARAAIVTERAWRRLFDGDSSVVGRALMLDARSVTVTGIVANDDSLGPDPDFFLAQDEGDAAFLDRSVSAAYSGIGRLAPGVDQAVVREQIQAVTERIAETYATGRAGHTVVVQGLREYYSGYNWRPLYFFLGASLVVLLLSAVNVAALLLARALRRTREFALRGALGGGQRAIAEQLLVEGSLVAAPGGAIGVLLATWAVRIFATELPTDVLARGATIPIDLRVCAFATAVTALTTIAFVMTPLFLARRIDLSSVLGPGTRTGRSAREGRARAVLLTVQIALTVVLLSGAAIFLKSFVGLVHRPLGFEPAGAWAARATLSGPRYSTDDQVRDYASRLVEATRAIPGVRNAAAGTSSPFSSGPIVWFVLPDQPRPAAGEEPRALLRAVTAGYFQTLAIPLTKGRDISAADVAGAPRSAIVNDYLVEHVLGGGNPIGRVIELLPAARANWTRHPGALTIVGVVANVREVGFNEVPFADIYVPFAQMPAPAIEVVARAAAGAPNVAGAIRVAAAAIDPTIPVTSVATFDTRVDQALQGDRFNLLLICGFAGVAVLLAGIGIYGAVAYAVQARNREFGVRLALGARPSRLVGTALWQATRLGLVGGVAGLAVTLVIARVLGSALYLVPGDHEGLLFGVMTTDPAMLGSAFFGIVILALVAGVVPARRIARVDPALTLRND